MRFERDNIVAVTSAGNLLLAIRNVGDDTMKNNRHAGSNSPAGGGCGHRFSIPTISGRRQNKPRLALCKINSASSAVASALG